jgi:four helix bundle protein
LLRGQAEDTRGSSSTICTWLEALIESMTQLEIAGRRRFISEEQTVRMLAEADEIGRMLYGLIASLERRLTQ